MSAHNLSWHQLKERFPEALVEPRQTTIARCTKSQATQQALREANPEYKKIWTDSGKRLADHRATLSDEENKAIQHRSTETYLSKYTPEMRSQNSQRGGLAAQQAHPELAIEGAAVLAKYAKSDKGRQTSLKTAKRLWANPEHRKNISRKNKNAVIEGRIPLITKGIRPTKHERILIKIIEKHKLPLEYVGDNRLRIPTPLGERSWRNPDFIQPNSNRVVLLDQSRCSTTQPQETSDYQTEGYEVIRVLWKELKDEWSLVERIKSFLHGSLSNQ